MNDALKNKTTNEVKPMSIPVAFAIIAGVWAALSGLVYLLVKGQIWLWVSWLWTTDIGVSVGVGFLLLLLLGVVTVGTRGRK